ncbi:MAG: hypothetical protein H6850_02465 [Alphaproteobacteria bacterium]|nr:MAG: hypothetical protein H6850_02465 [Alphaproteobacteria bacterium]
MMLFFMAASDQPRVMNPSSAMISDKNASQYVRAIECGMVDCVEGVKKFSAAQIDSTLEARRQRIFAALQAGPSDVTDGFNPNSHFNLEEFKRKVVKFPAKKLEFLKGLNGANLQQVRAFYKDTDQEIVQVIDQMVAQANDPSVQRMTDPARLKAFVDELEVCVANFKQKEIVSGQRDPNINFDIDNFAGRIARNPGKKIFFLKGLNPANLQLVKGYYQSKDQEMVQAIDQMLAQPQKFTVRNDINTEFNIDTFDMILEARRPAAIQMLNHLNEENLKAVKARHADLHEIIDRILDCRNASSGTMTLDDISTQVKQLVQELEATSSREAQLQQEVDGLEVAQQEKDAAIAQLKAENTQLKAQLAAYPLEQFQSVLRGLEGSDAQNESNTRDIRVQFICSHIWSHVNALYQDLWGLKGNAGANWQKSARERINRFRGEILGLKNVLTHPDGTAVDGFAADGGITDEDLTAAWGMVHTSPEAFAKNGGLRKCIKPNLTEAGWAGRR